MITINDTQQQYASAQQAIDNQLKEAFYDRLWELMCEERQAQLWFFSFWEKRKLKQLRQDYWSENNLSSKKEKIQNFTSSLPMAKRFCARS